MPTRRQVLGALGSVGLLSVAGCSALGGSGGSSGGGSSGSSGGGSGGNSPPDASFRIEFESGRYTVYHDGGETINTDNTGLLAVDDYVDGKRQPPARNIWFTAYGDPVQQGDSEKSVYDQDVTAVRVNWGPPGCEGDCVGSLTTLHEASP